MKTADPNCPHCQGRGRYRVPYTRDEFVDCDACLASSPNSATSNATADDEASGNSALQIDIAVRVRSYTRIAASISEPGAGLLRNTSSRLSKSSVPSKTPSLAIAISFEIDGDFGGEPLSDSTGGAA